MDYSTAEELNLTKLKPLKILGKGAMGTVFLIKHHNSHVALKVVDKSSTHDSDRRARWELQVLSQLAHPFLPSLLGFFETDTLLGWALPYCPGGDLNLLRYNQPDRVFSPTVIRFYLAQILCALDHLHTIGIAYRDLKPENVLIQQSGHVTLTDFDLSRKLKKHEFHFDDSCRRVQNISIKSSNKIRKVTARVNPVSRRRKASFSDGERSNSFVGTEEYVAPEVIRGEGHEFAVDWWGLGVLTYEMLYGTTPFKGKNRKETFRNVLFKEVEFVGRKTVLTELIGKLLQKDPTKRLGYVGGAKEIKEHEFFSGVKWDMLTEVVRPPFIPSRDDDGDFTRRTESMGVGGVINTITEYFAKLKCPSSPLTSRSSEFENRDSFTEF